MVEEFVAAQGINGRPPLLPRWQQEMSGTGKRSARVTAPDGQHEPHHGEECRAGLSDGAVEVSNLDENVAGAHSFGRDLINTRCGRLSGRQVRGYEFETREGDQSQEGPV